MPWGSNVTNIGAPAPYEGNSESMYKLGAGERKKTFDKKVAEARAGVRSKYYKKEMGPKIQALEIAIKQAESELADLESQQRSFLDEEVSKSKPVIQMSGEPTVPLFAQGPVGQYRSPSISVNPGQGLVDQTPNYGTPRTTAVNNNFMTPEEQRKAAIAEHIKSMGGVSLFAPRSY